MIRSNGRRSRGRLTITAKCASRVHRQGTHTYAFFYTLDGRYSLSAAHTSCASLPGGTGDLRSGDVDAGDGTSLGGLEAQPFYRDAGIGCAPFYAPLFSAGTLGRRLGRSTKSTAVPDRLATRCVDACGDPGSACSDWSRPTLAGRGSEPAAWHGKCV